ncbi:MAG: TldD/PmbA family protein [Acidobacteriota bacterium]|nr:TldD/PmbA family protein [Acidobacteriota bacterium]
MMSNELMDLAAWTIKEARGAGADQARVRISSNRAVEVGYRERKPETIKEASTRNLGVEIFAGGRYSSQTTSDLRRNAMRAFIANAVASTKLLAEDPFRTLPDAKFYEGREDRDLGLFDPGHGAFRPEDRHALVKAAEAAALAEGGKDVISVSAQSRDSAAESVMISSNGFQGARKSTSYSLMASMTLQDAGDRRPNGWAYAVTADRKSLPSPKTIGREAAKNTRLLLGAKKLKTETLPVIIVNRMAGWMLNGFLQPLYGRNIDQKQSFLLDKLGKTVGSRHFTLIDDPFIQGGLGSRTFDGDGLTAKKMVLVENGVLRNYYIDWYYSRKLGWEPTTGSPSNLIIPPGSRSVSDIMKDLGRGILLTGFIGGNSNPTTGDTSIGISGRLFEDGVPVQSVAEMNIADNHLKFWERLIEVADDPWIYSSMRMPSLVVDKVVVAGV